MSRMLAKYPDQRFATSGEVALRLARESTPDLILLDLDMPGMNGLDVCRALKEDPLLASVPVIFATSHEGTALEVVALQSGADFVTKPLVAVQLTARVRAQLRSKELFDALKSDSLVADVAPPPHDVPAPRLLIVDDDVASIQILRHALATMGDFHFAKTGEEALQLARRLVPDLILLDAHMPGLDGFDVCKTLKAEPAFKHVPIAFVTRFSDPRNEMRALDLGAADFIAKPYTRAVLQARVRNLLDLKRRADAELQAVRDHWRRFAEARVSAIVGAASDAILTYDATARVVLINAAACAMFGVEQEDAIGSPVVALLGDDVANPGRWRDTPARIRLIHTNGDSFPVEASVSQVGEGAECLTTVMLRNISDRERLEAETCSRIEAEAASRTKTEMMSYIAHEMGNPLNGLLGFAQLMAADTAQPLAPAQAKRLDHIVASGQQLQNLMRDVMDVGRLDAGKLSIDLRPVNAVHIACDATEAVFALAEHAGVALSPVPQTPSLWVTADTNRLQQCLVNLLSNAIKYNRPGGWARIELSGDSEAVSIAVRDNGLGLNTVQREHLFEAFNRLGRQHESAPGAGLGLVITRRLVEAMNGQLRVESAAGLGSCFTIVLPGAAHA